MKPRVLITGGAGYIGSHVLKQLLEQVDCTVSVLDNFSTGFQSTLEILSKIRVFKVIRLDLQSFDEVEQFLNKNRFDAIIHFAASIVAPESVEKPLKYYMNNTVNTTNLIRCACETGVKKFIFSSTAAVYGDTGSEPIRETMLTSPINPYGSSKLMSEQVLKDTSLANPAFRHVILRYFNVAGADTLGRIGQSTPNATNLIKLAAQCALGKREKLSIFGNDYQTKDGTGVRDYIHVEDLASAHLMALEYLDEHESDLFNVGYGHGFSVNDVIKAMKEVSGVDFKVEIAPRREGDIEMSVADCSKIKSKMDWQPKLC